MDDLQANEGVAEVIETAQNGTEGSVPAEKKPRARRRTKAEMEAARAGGETTVLATTTIKDPILERVSPREQAGKEMLETISAWQIETQEEMDLAGKIEAHAVAERKKLEAELKEITGPMRAAEERVRKLFRPAIGFFAAAEDAVKAKVKEFRQAAIAAQDAALKAIADSGGIAPAHVLVVAHGAGVLELPKNLKEKFSFTWTATDAAKIPEQYWQRVLNTELIDLEVSQKGFNCDIPGIKVDREVDIHNKPVRK